MKFFLLLLAGIVFSVQWAAQAEEQEDVLEQFMDIFSSEKFDVNAVNELGATVLHIAAASISDKNHISVVIPKLLELGADINAQDNDGDTPLHLAVYNGNVEAVRILTMNKADVHLYNDKGFAPIHLAAIISTPETFKIIVDASGDVNFPNKDGDTSFHLFLGRMALGLNLEDENQIKEFMKLFEDADGELENEIGITPQDILSTSEKFST